jgi:hypothetical protein
MWHGVKSFAEVGVDDVNRHARVQRLTHDFIRFQQIGGARLLRQKAVLLWCEEMLLDEVGEFNSVKS